ncbi:MAG: hypothetical protein JWO08_7 [Verrucomicrobiaceae bacterium]|nr:hypothetical protein [Verrucomicrobiaceae bacterium]
MKILLLSAVLLGPAAFRFCSLAQETKTAASLEALGGKVVLAQGSVSQLSFTDCSKLGDAEFRAIGSLAHLKSLTLYGKCHGLDDTTIVHLAGLKELESIGTDGAQLTDEGLKHFAAFTALRSAAFFHTSFGMKGFTGRGFGALQACPNLERLTVAGISMGDEGFAAIAQIQQLRDLSTWHTYQTEAGNAEIAKLPLQSLRIGQRLPHAGAKPSLTDASLPVFAAMKTLENVKLGEAHFTVEALTKLKELPKLKSLTLFETDLSVAEAESLRTALPGVKLDVQPLTGEQRKKFEMYLK